MRKKQAEQEPEEEGREIRIFEGEYTGKPPRPLRRTADLLLGAALIAAAFFGFGAYYKLAIPAAAIGLATVIAQHFINRGEPPEGRLKVSVGVRIFAAAVLAFYIALATGMFSNVRLVYPLHKGLFRFANGIASEELEHLPDSLPSGCSELEGQYDAPRWGDEETGHIELVFTADSEAVEALRSEAVSKGGELSDKYSIVSRLMQVICEKYGRQPQDAEVYVFGAPGAHCPAYLIDGETGICALCW